MFAHRGYDGVSLDDIAKHCGANRSLILYYYKSKTGLWRAAATDVIRDFNETMERKLENLTARDEDTRLRKSIGAWIDGFIEKPECAKLIMREGATPGTRLEWLLKMRGVHLLEVESVSGPNQSRRTAGRVAALAIMYSLATIAPLLESSTALAAGGKPAGVHPLSKKTREELINLLAIIITHSRQK